MGNIPKTLHGFKNEIYSNLHRNIDSTEYSNATHLKTQLIETNTQDIPYIKDFSTWKPFEDTTHWFYCSNDNQYVVLNKFSNRIWILYSLMDVKSFRSTIDLWIKNTINLDHCWIPSSRIKKYVTRDLNWNDRGVGIRYNDFLSDEEDNPNFSLKAWYGSNKNLIEILSSLEKNFAVSSYRFKDEQSSSVSEWYSDGKITFNSSSDVDTLLNSINGIADYYHSELAKATKYRNESNGAFELNFTQNINLEKYTIAVNSGKSELKLWLSEISSQPDFKRYRGIDMHTWDRVFVDIGDKFAYLTVPGNGCVNAAPRMLTLQGETIMGRTTIFYNGDEIFV